MSKRGEESRTYAQSIPWQSLVVEQGLSANQIGREIKREGKWVLRNVPEDLYQMLRTNGSNRQKDCLKEAPFIRWGK